MQWKPIETWCGEPYRMYIVCDKNMDWFYVAYRGKNDWYDVENAIELNRDPDFWLDGIPAIPQIKE